MANEFKVKNGLISAGAVTAGGADVSLGYKNILVNGDCRVSARGGVALSNGAGYVYGSADLFAGAIAVTSLTSANFDWLTALTYSSTGYGIGCTVVGCVTPTNGIIGFRYAVEAKDVVHLNGKTVTFSAKIGLSTMPAGTQVNIHLTKPTTTKDVWSGTIGTDLSVSTAVTATNGLLVSKTFTMGSTDASNGLAVAVVFILPASGSFSGAVSASDFQLVTGSIIPEMEHPPTSVQVAYCRRYYRAGTTRIGAYGTTNGYLITSAAFEDMRTTPTITSAYTYTNGFGGFAGNVGTTNFRTGCQVTATGMAEFTNAWTASAEL